MRLRIITKDCGLQLDETIEFLQAASESGTFGIYKDHAPMMTMLKNTCDIRYKKQGDEAESNIQVQGGILEVNREISVSEPEDESCSINILASSVSLV